MIEKESKWNHEMLLNALKNKIIQAPMAGGITTPELVASVSNAGGMGSLGAGYMTPQEIRSAIKQIKALTNQPFAVNLFVPQPFFATDLDIEQARQEVQAACPELKFPIPTIHPPYAPSFDEQMQVLLEEKVAIFSFTFGIPSKEWIEAFKNQNIKLLGTATTLAEAKLLEEAEVDAIIAQGSEAGGHRGTFITAPEDGLNQTSHLVPILVEYCKVPIIAAGGIMDALDIVKFLRLGAFTVQMGTVFLCCPESGAHPSFKKLLLNLNADETVLTRAFSGKLARGINNQFIERMQSHVNTIIDYPIQNALTIPMRKEAAKQNNTDFMSMWAGKKAYQCTAISAAELVQSLNREVILLKKN